ncbi:MAG: putative toxin-antitoxin system toxin component, PIN family, partial [Nitrospirales bacterium]
LDLRNLFYWPTIQNSSKLETWQAFTFNFRVSSFLSAQYPDVNLDPILSLLVAKAKLIQATELPTPICSDPDDDKFIACAVSGKSKFIISGDKELLKVSGYRGIQILSPRAFLDHYL